MTVTGKADVPLTLNRTPLLKYTNPVRRVQQHGAIYVWTLEDRPAAIASFWSAMPEPDWRRLNFEWHSLHGAPVGAEYEGERIWKTEEAGLEWQALTDAASPAALRPQRLVQMRRIASSFAVEIQTQESELRLMRQPIFRYPESAGGVVDGAIFAFVMGTDPELFLLVEARAATNGTQQWHVGIARFTNAPLRVRRDGREWWSCPHFPARVGAPVRDRKFFIHLEVKRLPADPGEMGKEERR
ncbi:MAG: hypothetical protein KY476_18670 [Planctomycetes bacterium]|nr:hypothetical protein [Planctomycetota bacterium]